MAYADDLALYAEGNNAETLMEKINNALESLAEWISAHNLEIAL